MCIVYTLAKAGMERVGEQGSRAIENYRERVGEDSGRANFVT